MDAAVTVAHARIGRDAAVAGVLADAAWSSNCDLFLALLTIEDNSSASMTNPP
jgi:hypothetical protein